MNIRIAIILTFAGFVGCGGAPINDSMEQPRERPEDAREASLPEGPDVDKRGIRPSSSAGNDRDKVAEIEPSSEEGGSTAGVISRAELESFRDRGPAHVLTLLEFEPVHSQSGFVGFSVKSAADPASSFMTPHVQIGDVVTHVNGIRMERPDDLLQAWNAIGEASVIRVDMIRQGTPFHVSWTVEE